MAGLQSWSQLTLLAIRRLEGHHSQSVLPRLAIAKRREERLGSVPAKMSDTAKANKGQSCTDCRKYVRYTATCCPDCGHSWKDVAYTAQAADIPWKEPTDGMWQGAWQERAVSPRPRRPKSP